MTMATLPLAIVTVPSPWSVTVTSGPSPVPPLGRLAVAGGGVNKRAMLVESSSVSDVSDMDTDYALEDKSVSTEERVRLLPHPRPCPRSPDLLRRVGVPALRPVRSRVLGHQR